MNKRSINNYCVDKNRQKTIHLCNLRFQSFLVGHPLGILQTLLNRQIHLGHLTLL